MARWMMLAPPAVFAALAGMFLLGLGRDNPSDLPSAFEGKPAPRVEMTPMPGHAPWTGAALRGGEITLVNFWASWCAPCRVEHPNLAALAREGITILGVNYKDDPQKAQGFLDELGSPYAALGADRQGRMALDWGVYGVPETFVVDGAGKVLFRFAGPVTERVIAERLRPLLAPGGAPAAASEDGAAAAAPAAARPAP